MLLSPLFTLNLFAQRITDSIAVCNLPVRSGNIYVYDLKSLPRCIGPVVEENVSILTKCDSVFHFGEGKIVAINNYGGDGEPQYMIVIGNEKKEYFAYGNLKSSALKKGDVVRRGTLIGFADNSDDGEGRQIDLIFIKNGKELPFKKTIDFIRCQAQCKSDDDYNL